MAQRGTHARAGAVTRLIVDWWKSEEFTMMDVSFICATAFFVWWMDGYSKNHYAKKKRRAKSRASRGVRNGGKRPKKRNSSRTKGNTKRISIGDAELPMPLGTGTRVLHEERSTTSEGEEEDREVRDTVWEARSNLVLNLCDRLEDSEFTTAEIQKFIDVLLELRQSTQELDELLADSPASVTILAQPDERLCEEIEPADDKPQPSLGDSGAPDSLTVSEIACSCRGYWYQTIEDGGDRAPCAVCDLLVQTGSCVYVEANDLRHKELLAAGEQVFRRRKPSKKSMMIGDDGDQMAMTSCYPGDEDGALDGLILSKHGFAACSSRAGGDGGDGGGGGADVQTDSSSAFNLRVCYLCSKALDEGVMPLGALARGFWIGGDV